MVILHYITLQVILVILAVLVILLVVIIDIAVVILVIVVVVSPVICLTQMAREALLAVKVVPTAITDPQTPIQ